ncbi:MAG: hypothetical protein K0S39_3360, partial [Paenibacillus sp.]|nr:hypothetical protein [Paenibacillus sp.]
MRLTSELVIPILKQLHAHVNCCMSITDEYGTVIACTDTTKINTNQPDTLEVQQT